MPPAATPQYPSIKAQEPGLSALSEKNDLISSYKYVTHPLDWWSTTDIQQRFPRLSQMAIDIFAIPAVSDEPERTFSSDRECKVSELRDRETNNNVTSNVDSRESRFAIVVSAVMIHEGQYTDATYFM